MRDSPDGSCPEITLRLSALSVRGTAPRRKSDNSEQARPSGSSDLLSSWHVVGAIGTETESACTGSGGGDDSNTPVVAIAKL